MKSYYFIFIFLITGWVSAQVPVSEQNFGTCKLPDGWSFVTVNGNYGFGIVQDKVSLFPDGSCLIGYEQNLRSDITRRRFQLKTSDFSIGGYDRYYLVFKLQYARPYNSAFNLYMNYGTGNVLVRSFSAEIRDLTAQGVTLSIPTSATKVNFYFEYDFNGNDGGTKILLDDFILSPDNSDCQRALPLTLGSSCLSGHIAGVQPLVPGQMNCAGSYQGTAWYKYTADFTGLLRIRCQAGYNNAVSVFEGTCVNMTSLNCVDKDEFGFEGEDLDLNVISGRTYYIRTARKINDFGTETGSHCISISKADKPLDNPGHDLCDNRIKVQVNGVCVQGLNRNAGTESRLPTKNQRSRADVWYEFTALSAKPHEVITQSNFADVIAIFEGSCASLKEVVAEDQGNRLEFVPVAGKTYFVQVTGYFATLEGDLCLRVQEKDVAKPQNDICATATQLNLNATCNTILFPANNLSTVKPSCVVYHAPDVWYSFTAPAEKQVALQVKAGFIFHYAVYSGNCNALVEKQCGLTPDPCAGFIKISDLIAGQKYYLQIMAANKPLQPGEGSLCVRVDELSKAANFEPLNLNLNLDCLHGVLGRVNYSVSGGIAPVVYTGPSSQDFLFPGQKAEAFAEDANGCRSFATVEAICTPPSKCKNSSLQSNLQFECLTDSIGRQTGEVILRAGGKGGSGVYYFYGTPDGSKLKHEDLYKVLIIDSDSCYVVEEGKIDCPPFDCARSPLKVDVSYECVDTLLKAVLTVDVTGQMGQISLEGDQTGKWLDSGESYFVKVTDQAGCSREISGTVVCNFDSCAYARPQLEVDYLCITGTGGGQTGQAILIVNGASKAGGINYSGNQPGDTLDHGEKYSVKMVDAFGCSLESAGEVDCVISSVSDEKNPVIGIKPNPTNGWSELSVLWPTELNSGKLYFSLLTPEGQILEHKVLTAGQSVIQHKLDLSAYPPGVYSIRISSGNLTAWTRVVRY